MGPVTLRPRRPCCAWEDLGRGDVSAISTWLLLTSLVLLGWAVWAGFHHPDRRCWLWGQVSVRPGVASVPCPESELGDKADIPVAGEHRLLGWPSARASLHAACTVAAGSAFPVAAAGRPSIEAKWYPEILVLSASWACGCRRGQPQAGGGSAAPVLLCPQADICGRHARKDYPVSKEDQDGEPLNPDRRGAHTRGWARPGSARTRQCSLHSRHPSPRLDTVPWAFLGQSSRRCRPGRVCAQDQTRGLRCFGRPLVTGWPRSRQAPS